MTIELPEPLEIALKQQATARGVSPEILARELLQGELLPAVAGGPAAVPFKSSFGILAKYGPAPSAEDIDEVRADMWKNFGEGF